MQEHLYSVLLTPLFTEKATHANENQKYSFKVAPKSNKKQVKQAVEKIFDVQVVKVNILNVKGKTKTFKGKIGKRSGYKKALITLAKGKTLDLGLGVK